ncbi:MAG: TusE/DsrC/DsvC family sulfur relay protein [Desulforhopalus sp.]
MTILTSGNKKIMVDEEGFLEDAERWDEDVARTLAENEGIEKLDDEKFEILKVLREHYKKFKSFPILGKICRNAGGRSKDCINEEFVNPMSAWKIAGLPKPPNIFYTSFDGKKYTPNPFY